MTAFDGYPVSILIAVVFHGLILAFLLYFESAETEVIDIVRPPVVKAILVNENPQVRNEELRTARAQQEREQQREAERRRQEQQQQDQQRREEAAAEQRRAEEQRRLQAEREQTERQQQAERQRAERERSEREAAERRQQEELQRQQELAARQAAERERQEQAARDAEARELAETDAEIVMAYTAVIHDLVQRQWSRPPSARNGMMVVLRIRLAPTGDILGNVEIVQSSGDYAFDRAAETAVLQVGRFRELQNMPPRLFERNFRSLLLTFRPEDLLN